MAEAKTKATKASVDTFLNSIPDDQVRADSRALVQMMQNATKALPQMWGTTIVGFGTYRQTYANGKEGDWPIIAFAPRKEKITLYIKGGFKEYDELMAQLGKHSGGKSCVYIKRLSDVDLPALKKLIKGSVKQVSKRKPPKA